jgi:DNA-binding NtrC family response regulator
MPRKPIRVLLIDDDEAEYVLTKDILSFVRGTELRLDWAGSFESGRAAIAAGAHDVYLVDYCLDQGRSGVDLVRDAVRAGCEAPIVLLTGQGSREVDVAAMEAGAAAYLVKGAFDPAGLERAIRYAIENSRRSRGTAAS